MEFAIVLGVVLGIVVGVVIGGIVVQLRNARTRATLESESALVGQRLELADRENEGLTARAAEAESNASTSAQEAASLRAQLVAVNTRLQEQLNIEHLMADKFKALSAEAISDNSEKFLKNANERIGTLVKPLSEHLKNIETERARAQGSLTQQIATLAQSNRTLEQETRNLTTALKRPEVRGTWGEIQLRRVVELAGMTNYCDFEEQVSVASATGGQDRPDMVVRMPNQRTIIIDAKTPMDAYLSATESETDKARGEALARHAGQVRERARDLSQKSYWRSFENTPEFVVMFLPGEVFLLPALERDPTLLDWAMERRVVIATPNTLMALLKTVEMGWQEVQLADKAREIGRLGRELHDRIQTWASHMVKMESTLSRTVDHFNSSVGSLESMVLTSARRFKELGVSSDQDIPPVPVIEKQVRHLAKIQAPPTTPALTEPTEQEQQQPLLGS